LGMPSVFISYAQVDGSDFARKLHDDLEAAGMKAFLDERDIKEGQNIELFVRSNLMKAQAILAVLTPGALSSNYVTGELARAVEDDLPVIPLVVAEGSEPTSLGAIKRLDFRGDYGAALQRLIERLATVEQDHLEALRLKLETLTREQAHSPSPERLQTKIDRLRAQIESRASAHEAAKDAQRRSPPPDLDQIVGSRSSAGGPSMVGVPLPDIGTHFLDREAPLARLEALLADRATRVVTVLGRGGAGKSAFVAHALREREQIGGRPFKGVVSLSARPPHELNADDVYAAFGELIGGRGSERLTEAWSRPSSDMAAKAIAVLRELNDGVYVLLLDNVETALDERRQFQDNGLQALLEAWLSIQNDLLLLMTSRVPVAFRKELLAYDEQITLTDGLPPEDGIEMLRALDASGRSGLRDLPPETLAALVRTVHGLPRALELIAYALGNDPLLPVNDLLDRHRFLASDEVMQELVAGAYSRVDRDALRVLEGLAVYGQSVPPAAVEFLLEPYLPQASTRQALRFLVQSHVASATRASGTVGLHPLDRDYLLAAIPLTGEGGLTELNRRAADYYAQVRKPEAEWRALGDLRPQLLELQHRVAAEDYAGALSLLAVVDESYLEVWGYNRRLVSMRRELATKVLDPLLQMRNLVRLARAEHRLGEYDLAIETNRRARALCVQTGDRDTEATCLNYIGINYHFLGDYPSAIASHKKALQLVTEPRREAACLNALGNSYNQIGAYDDAIQMHERALAIREKLDNRRWLSDSYHNIGELKVNLGRLAEALKDFTRPLPATLGGGQWSDELTRFTNSSMVLIELGEFDQARRRLTRALVLMRRALEWRWEDTQRGLLADIDRCLGSYEEASKGYDRALELSASTGSRHRRVRHSLGIATIQRLRDRHLEAASTAREAFTEAVRITDATGQAAGRLELLLNLLLLGRIEEASRVAAEALAVKVPFHYHRVLLLNGFVAARTGDRRGAAGWLEQARTEAAVLLTHSPQFVAAGVSHAISAHAISSMQEPQNLGQLSALSDDPYIRRLDMAPGLLRDAQQLFSALMGVPVSPSSSERTPSKPSVA
jgi:tetratricopeptide (TPR) repeat protein